MLEIKNISKSYTVGDFTQVALDDFSLKFRPKEFVSILGPSGSGKTTLLNIIGGLDHYDKGDLIINNKSTKNFTEKEWDSYRNNCIGFVFQNYNLISHISVLENIEMGMTLSGVGTKEKKIKAYEALKRVGLEKHANKKPNQLSGGQMQRVAIARALATNPDIILADEPTGALDSKTSKQIMELIKEISKDKLVIMVTHNRQIAEEYSTRVVELKDGKLLSDSNPVTENEKSKNNFNIRKTAMSFFTALRLSFNNIKTKKGRTAITAFASSIGIIGIALILSLSNGFKIEIDKFEKESLSEAPIIISKQTMKLDSEMIANLQTEYKERETYTKKKQVYVLDNTMETMTHTNSITEDYMKYLEGLSKDDIAGISYQKGTALNMITYNKEKGYQLINNTMMGVSTWTLLPSKVNKNEKSVIEENFDIIAGKIDESKPGLILQVDSRNQIYENTLEQLGLNGKEVSFTDILNQEIKIILNDNYYIQNGEFFIPNTDYESLYNNENSITIKVQAIIRGKESKKMLTQGTGIAYTDALVDLVISKNKDSAIVKAQQEKNYNILTQKPFDEQNATKETILGYLGAENIPVAIYIYPKDFNAKDNITSYLDNYNNSKDEESQIKYTDMADMISSLSGNIMDAITIVLIAFSSISLVVSSIMIGIITYISVLERTKEIGILRALGARKKDIKRVFNAETFIIGIFSGLLGIIIARLLVIPTNIIIENASELPNVAKLSPIHAIILIAISVLLTIIGGLIPASMAAKKDPVEALRTE